jgi:hypothetical protein
MSQFQFILIGTATKFYVSPPKFGVFLASMWILEYRNSLILLRLIMNLIVAFLTFKKVNHDALLIHGMLNIAIYGHISRGLNGVGSQNKFHPLFLGSQTHSSNLHHLFKITLMTKLVPKT